MKKAIGSLWISGSLGPYEHLCLRSFSERGLPVELYSYSFQGELPDGVVLRDANEIISEKEKDWRTLRREQFATFADLFRYSLLAQRDLIWVDTDVLMVGEFQHIDGYVLGFEGPGRVNNAVLGYPQDSQLALTLQKKSGELYRPDLEWGTIGPILLTDTVARLGLWSRVQSEHAFYPIPMRQAWAVFDSKETKRVTQRVSKSACVHLWNEILRENPVNLKNRLPELGSFARQQIDAMSMVHRFDADSISTNSSKWLLWRRGIDPGNQKQTFTMKLRDLISLLPHGIRWRVNLLAAEARRKTSPQGKSNRER